MQAKLPAARARSVKAVSAVDAGEVSRGTRSRQAAVPRLTCASGRCQDVRGVPGSAPEEALVRLRQAPVRGPEGRARLSVALHPPRRHLEQPPDRSQPAQRHRIEGPGRYTTMTLDVGEFIRRFLIHVLPKGFHRIRHYGLFASASRAETIARARELLGLATSAAEAAVEIDPAAAQPLAQPCPCCGGRMFVIETFEAGCQPRYRPTAPVVAIRIDTS